MLKSTRQFFNSFPQRNKANYQQTIALLKSLLNMYWLCCLQESCWIRPSFYKQKSSILSRILCLFVSLNLFISVMSNKSNCFEWFMIHRHTHYMPIANIFNCIFAKENNFVFNFNVQLRFELQVKIMGLCNFNFKSLRKV